MEKLQELKKNLKLRIKELSGYKLKNNQVKFHEGEVFGSPIGLQYYDSDWNFKKLPFVISNDENVWIRKRIKVPEKIRDIDLSGSKLEIKGYNRLFPPVILGKGELYIDGIKIFDEENWIELTFPPKTSPI